MNVGNTIICCLMLFLPFEATYESDAMSCFSTLQPSPAKTSRASTSVEGKPLTSDSVTLSTPGPNNGLTRISADREELRLFRDLFHGYDKRLRPVLRREDNVTVKLGISLHQLVDLDERNQVIKLSFWVRQIWYNPFLRWNKTHYSGISEINIEPSDVWKPDLVLYNNADDSTDGSLARFKTEIKVNSEGKHMWLSPVILRSSCKVTVKYFPFDKQHCELKFGSWTYDGFHLDLIPEAPTADIAKFVKNGEWDLVGVPCKRNVVKYVCCEAPYPDITYAVQIRRRTLFFFFNLVIPCLVIVALTILSFYLPPDSGERISLVITNLLAMTVFMLLVAEIIPPTSDEVSIISIFYSCCIFEVAFALVGTCLVLKYHFSNPSIHKMPGWVRFAVIHCLGKVFRKEAQDGESNKLHNKKSVQAQRGNYVGTDDSAFIEPFIPRSDHSYKRYSGIEKRLTEMSKGKWPTDLRSHNIGEKSDRESKEPFQENQNGDHGHESFFIRALIHKQSAIADALKKLVETQDAQDEEVKERSDWMIAASIMDSMFLWLFLVMLVASLLVLFFRIPNYDEHIS